MNDTTPSQDGDSKDMDDGADSDDSLCFAEELSDTVDQKNRVWRILIVDDSQDVHEATTFALAGLQILGRPLEFLHAYSAREGKDLMRTEQHLAVVLLDVVMESEDAGLKLVKVIREELRLTDLRILLRTGQPGYAPEIQTIHDYDINDYITKSELTRSKLFTTVTASLRAYQQIRSLDDLAFYDKLSNLPNRNAFIGMIDGRLAHASRDDYSIALIDLDDFSEINDALGYQQGDRLLQAVAERLTEELGMDTSLARIGGDTFGVLGTAKTVDPHFLLGLFRQPFSVHDDLMVVTATVGLARLTDVGDCGEDALKDANIALKRAKKRYRGQYETFSIDMGIEIRERVRLLQGLRGAFEKDRLYIAYQPQVELATGQAIGAEALLRWKGEDGRMVPPDRFIPLAEYSGLIVNIGEWILRGACHELMRLIERGAHNFRMSINVSLAQFQHPDFLQMLESALTDTRVPPNCVELEITESMAMDEPSFMLDTLRKIKRLGVSVAVDDFGTGYSSLSQLRQLPVDRLKIDRAFVTELTQSIQGGHIAAMVVSLGAGLNLRVIAEGIEQEEQAEALRALGCHEGQGFLYAKPMEAAHFTDWLAERGVIA